MSWWDRCGELDGSAAARTAHLGRDDPAHTEFFDGTHWRSMRKTYEWAYEQRRWGDIGSADQDSDFGPPDGVDEDALRRMLAFAEYAATLGIETGVTNDCIDDEIQDIVGGGVVPARSLTLTFAFGLFDNDVSVTFTQDAIALQHDTRPSLSGELRLRDLFPPGWDGWGAYRCALEGCDEFRAVYVALLDAMCVDSGRRT